MAHAQTPARYVDASAAPGGNGIFWSTAYNDLQDALDDMPGLPAVDRVIFVAIGDYTPTDQSDPLDPRTARFLIPNGTQLYGGFLNGQTFSNREERFRDTELSGDLGSPMTTSDNAYNVVVIEQGSNPVLVDGFAVRGGNANHPSSSQFRSGAGIYSVGNELTLRNIFAELNVAADEGGAIYHSGPNTLDPWRSFRMYRSYIGNNSAGLRGGGVFLDFLEQASVPGSHGIEPSWIFNSTFYRNLAGTINHPQISQNGGGAIYLGITQEGAPPLLGLNYAGIIVMNCQMHDNAVYGGGAAVYLENSGTADETLWMSSTMAFNRVLQGPGNGFDGGTVYTIADSSQQPRFINTIVYDTFDPSGSLNTIEAIDGSGSQTASSGPPPSWQLKALHCDIFTPGAGVYPPGGFPNVDTVPGFVSAGSRNFQLAGTSPLVDAGWDVATNAASLPWDYPEMNGAPFIAFEPTPYFIYTGPANDRVVDQDPLTPGDVDIGAFERQ